MFGHFARQRPSRHDVSPLQLSTAPKPVPSRLHWCRSVVLVHEYAFGMQICTGPLVSTLVPVSVLVLVPVSVFVLVLVLVLVSVLVLESVLVLVLESVLVLVSLVLVLESLVLESPTSPPTTLLVSSSEQPLVPSSHSPFRIVGECGGERGGEPAGCLAAQTRQVALQSLHRSLLGPM